MLAMAGINSPSSPKAMNTINYFMYFLSTANSCKLLRGVVPAGNFCYSYMQMRPWFGFDSNTNVME
jgi:hypothetical protein